MPVMGAEAPEAVRVLAPTVEAVTGTPAFLQKADVTTVRAAPVSQIMRPRAPLERKVMLLSFQELVEDALASTSTAAKRAVEGADAWQC